MREARDGPSRAIGSASGQPATGSTSGQPAITDERPGNSGTGDPAPRAGARNAQSDVAGTSFTQPTIQDDSSEGSQAAGVAPPPNQGVYQDVLVQCNALVEEYRKGEVSKASVYVDIQSKLAKALGYDRTRCDAAFGSFIATIESHDSEIEMAARRAAATGPRQRST
jgi:hypothetical protein